MTKPPNVIGRMLVSPRSLAEYREMFALTDAELDGAILDCPGGAAGFTAELSALGGRVTAVDPEYAGAADVIGVQALDDIERSYTYHRANPGQYVWTFFTDPDHYAESRTRSAKLFIEDFAAHPERYVTGALPNLPFPDGAFDLALMSHLLFSYLDRLDEDFHVASIVELLRVATQARIYPLVPMGSADPAHLPRIIERLHAEGLATEVRPVSYEFQRGGKEMLVVTRA